MASASSHLPLGRLLKLSIAMLYKFAGSGWCRPYMICDKTMKLSDKLKTA